MKYYNFIFIIQISFLIQRAKGLQPFLNTDIDYAASSVDLKNLIKSEAHLVLKFLDILDEEKGALFQSSRNLERMKTYLADFKSTLLTDVDLNLKLFKSLAKRFLLDFEGFGNDAAKHPFKSYRTIRRFIINLKELEESYSNTAIEKAIKEYEKLQPFPKHADLEIAALSILRLNQLFKLPVDDFLKGKLGPLNTSTSLTPEHLLEIGRVSIKNKFYSQSVDFIASAFENYRGNWTASKEAKDLLDEAISLHDKAILSGFTEDDVQPDSGPLFFSNLLHNTSHENFRNRKPVPLDLLLKDIDKDEPRAHIFPLSYTFEKLCRGEATKNSTELQNLKCYITNKNHPSLILSPLKVEVHNEKPFLVQYFDVVNEREMEELRNEVNGEMRMSRTIKSKEEVKGETTRFRTSSNAWITDLTLPRFQYLTKRIERMLRVNATGHYASEDLQIAAYSPGGHYVPHTDAVFEEEIIDVLDPSEHERGDRIITFMIYLSDVEYGGSTVFPFLKAAVQPVKGSAVVWHNLDSDGSINRGTLHGGCSVVYGVKWIANKWIRMKDQTFLKQCPASKSQWTFNI